MTVVYRSQRLINVEDFADNLIHPQRLQARGMLIEVSKRGLFILER